MRNRDFTLSGSPENYIPEMKKTRPELLKSASESVDKLQRLIKRYEDQITKPKPSEPFGPYRSAHPMTECIADQKSKKNPPRNPAAVCQFIRTRSKKSASSDTTLAEWDSLSKVEQEGWCRVTDAMYKDGIWNEMSLEEIKAKIVDLQRQLDALPKQLSDPNYDLLYAEKQAYQEALTAKIKEELGLEKVSEDDPEILEDMVEGGKKPAVDLSLGAGAPVPTVKPPVKPVVVTPGTEKAFSPEARRAALEARRRKKKPKEEKKPVGLPEYLRERSRKAVRVGFVSSVPDDVGRSE